MEYWRKNDIRKLEENLYFLEIQVRLLKTEIGKTKKRINKLKYEGDFIICSECGSEFKKNPAWGTLCQKH
jgi:hypothetical protein